MTYNKEHSIKIVELVGGKDNIVSLYRCVSLLRFVLVDETKAKTEELLKLVPTVKGASITDGQLQVNIGTEVDSFYVPFVKDNQLESCIKKGEKTGLSALISETVEEGIRGSIVGGFSGFSKSVLDHFRSNDTSPSSVHDDNNLDVDSDEGSTDDNSSYDGGSDDSD